MITGSNSDSPEARDAPEVASGDFQEHPPSRNYSHDIRFGLSPNAVFDRAENRGTYREFVRRDDEGIQRGFEFRFDFNQGNCHSSATPSDCNDDDNRGNNHSSATPSDCSDDDLSSNVSDMGEF